MTETGASGASTPSSTSGPTSPMGRFPTPPVVGGQGGTATSATNNNVPRFGGAYNGSPDVFWIGGPPLADFSGTALASYNSPLAIRGISAESEIKGYAKRVLDGSSTKFKRDDPEFSLMAFAEEALGHMQTHGMDTVFYMTGVDSVGEGGEEVFTYHSKYTKSHVASFIQGKIANGTYDQQAQICLKESAQWLVNSLDESLKGSIRPQLTSRPTGPEVWMMIVSEVQSDSLRRCALLTEQFRSLSLSKYKGENVRDYAKAADDILLQLERDDQLPSTHLLDIVDHLSSCTVMDFKIHWMTKRGKVEEFVKETLGKSKQAVATLPNRIHYRDLLEEAKSKFINLQHLWGPGTPAKEEALLSQVKALKAQVAKMDQSLKSKAGGDGGKSSGDTSGQSKRKCFICDSTDHLKKDCPQKKSGGGGGNNQSPSTGKWAKPKDGEPHEKTVDGVKKFWCSKCGDGKGRWNNTHKTDAHKTKEELADSRAAGTPAGNLASVDQSLTSNWFG